MVSKRFLNIFIGLFAAVFVLLPALSLFTPQRDFSELENRVLQGWPSFSFSKLLSGEWIPQLEKMMNDQCFGRDGWVRLKATCDALLGKKDIGGAYLGRDGWLFEKRETPAPGQLEKNTGYVAGFAQWADKQGIRACFLPAYSAATYYPEHLPGYAAVADERAIAAALTGIEVLDPYEATYAHRDEAIYFKTDHHWTQRGAYWAYRTFAEKMGFDPLPWMDVSISPSPFYGTLYSRAPLPWIQADTLAYKETAPVEDIFYDGVSSGDTSPYKLQNLQKKDQYTVFLDGNHVTQDIRTGNHTGRTLAVMKDSFAHALAPLLAAHYDRIILIDLRYFSQPVRPYLLEQGVTDVLISYNMSWFAGDTNIVRLTR